LLFPELLGSIHKVPLSYLCLSLEMFSLYVHLVVSKFQFLHWGLWSIWNWFLCKMRDRDLVSVFYMWISTFPITIYWRGCLFSNVCFGTFVKNEMAVSCLGLFLILCYIPLVNLFVFVPFTLLFFFFFTMVCSIKSQILQCLQHCSFCFGYSGSFMLPYEF
jgi:hypothetical protein